MFPTALSTLSWTNVFEQALAYDHFLERFANPVQRMRWNDIHARMSLSPEQVALVSGFTRRMSALCLAGAWCGDCINQCPAFDHFARASQVIEVRFLDRDLRPDVREVLAINGGHRVPVVVFLSEDGHEVARYGERTLSIYRKMAVDQIGPTCPTGVEPPTDDLTGQVVAEWLAEFERAQLILRLSPRLRRLHSD